MSYIIPPNSRQVGDPNPPQDMDNTADMLGLLTRTLATLAGAGAVDPAGNAANVTTVQNFVGTAQPILSNPMTHTGDLIIGGTSGAPGRLASGTSGFVLTSTGTNSAPSWQSVSAVSGAAMLQPSGHTSGVTDATNIMNAINTNGYVWLAPGQWYVEVNQVILNNNTLNKTLIQGCGAGTVINAVGNGTSSNQATVIYMHGTGGGGTGANNQANPAGTVRDLVIDGTGAGNYVTGLDIGDGWGYRVDHIYTQNFGGTNTSTGGIGIRIGNDSYFTEKMVGTLITSRNNDTQVLMDSTVSSDISHGYCDLAFYLHLPVNTKGITITGPGSGNGVHLYGGELKVRGNHETNTGAQSGWIIGLVNGSNVDREHIHIRMEGNGGNPNSLTKVHFSGGGDSFTDCYGLLDITGAGGTTDGTTGQFHFAGMVMQSDMVAIRSSPADGWFS